MAKVNRQTLFLALIFLCIILFSCWTIYDAYAESPRNITVAWDYPNPPTDLAGFDLRINEDNDIMVVIPENVREWTGTLTFLDGNNTLDMRARDLAGQVSEWSEPCYYDPVPDTPGAIMITVSVVVTIN